MPPTVERFRRALTAFRGRGGGAALILVYHRVADLPFDPQLLAVTRANFEDQMAVVGGRYHTIALTELVTAIDNKSIGHGTVAVTFDDGYSDNLLNAKPILEQHGIPATVFVSSGYVGRDREYWWDELDRLLLQPGVLPDELALEVDGSTVAATLGPSAVYSDEEHERFRDWSVLQVCPTPRHRLYKSLCERLRPLGSSPREQALEQLRAWAGTDATARRSHRPMTADQLRQLRHGGLVDVGAHTVNHSLLAARPLEEQRAEIAGGKLELEELCGCGVRTFSYPFGGTADYSQESVNLVQTAGFDGACANVPGQVRSITDPLQMPRCLVRNWDVTEFEGRIDGWFRGRA